MRPTKAGLRSHLVRLQSGALVTGGDDECRIDIGDRGQGHKVMHVPRCPAACGLT
jgi:hypothetical protein